MESVHKPDIKVKFATANMSTVTCKVGNISIANVGENAKSDVIIHYGLVSGQPYFKNRRSMEK